MKKSQLYPFNKNALKGIALAVAIGTIGYCKIDKHNHAKNKFIKYNTRPQTNHKNPDKPVANTSENFQAIAIIYLENGEIALLINGEYLTMEAAMQKCPHLTADIQKYIAETHGTKTTAAENSLEK